MAEIDQLVLIGGPSCAGKTFLQDKMSQGECPQLSKQLGIEDPSSWPYLTTHETMMLRQPQDAMERAVVHYDMYSHYSKKHGFKHLQELIDRSDKVTILTLCVSPRVLIQRNNVRLIRLVGLLGLLGLRRLFKRSSHNPDVYAEERLRLQRFWKKRKEYKQGYSAVLYREWFDFLTQTSVTSHWLLDLNGSTELIARPYAEVADLSQTLYQGH